MATHTPTTTLLRGARASQSSIFLKILMAVTGFLFVLFVLAHMYGNLKAFAGHDAYDEYADHLRTIGTPLLPHSGFLWVLRVVLLVALVVHVYCAVVLWRRVQAARPVKYQVKKNVHSSLSSRTMRWGGLALLLFIVWHLLEFTIVKINVGSGPATDSKDPYLLLVDSFNVWWMTVIYLLAMLALAFHLHHGVWSASESLGWTGTKRARRNAKALGWIAAVVIAGGFSLVPFFILVGVIS